MDRWKRQYDEWLTSPPESKCPPVSYCEQCNAVLYHLDEVLHDKRISTYFCDKECFKKYLFTHIDEIEEFIDLLEESKDVESVVLEKD